MTSQSSLFVFIAFPQFVLLGIIELGPHEDLHSVEEQAQEVRQDNEAIDFLDEPERGPHDVVQPQKHGDAQRNIVIVPFFVHLVHVLKRGEPHAHISNRG